MITILGLLSLVCLYIMSKDNKHKVLKKILMID